MCSLRYGAVGVGINKETNKNPNKSFVITRVLCKMPNRQMLGTECHRQTGKPHRPPPSSSSSHSCVAEKKKKRIIVNKNNYSKLNGRADKRAAVKMFSVEYVLIWPQWQHYSVTCALLIRNRRRAFSLPFFHLLLLLSSCGAIENITTRQYWHV